MKSTPKSSSRRRIQIRAWTPADIPAVVTCQHAAYRDFINIDDHYDARKYEMQFHTFPEGQFLAEVDGLVVGYATSLIVQFGDMPDDYRYEEVTGAGTFSTHNQHGDTLYGADIAVHPDYRGKGISKRLYVARKKLLKKYNLRRMIAYGRIPGYKDAVGRYTPEEYIAEVKAERLFDPALTAHLSAGYDVKRVLIDYVWDESSVNICTLLEMANPRYNAARRRVSTAPIKRPVRKVRVCTAQYLLRDLSTWEEFRRTTEFFVEAADAYNGHFLVLPEMFTAQILNFMPREWDDLRQINELAGYIDRYRELFSELAQRYNLYIIAGSTPELRDGEIYNVGHLFVPSGRYFTQDKLHPTPSERSGWNLRPGQGLTVFETPIARIAIQICYDIEFPEPARLLTLAGAEIIFVPYSTDDRKGHTRVSLCSRARAIENSIYVVTSGNAGTIMNRGYLLNHAESAVYTPSDYGFPPEAIAGRAEPNEETVVVADLELSLLDQNREIGSTRPLYDRRTDLYELRPRIPIRTVRAE